MMKLYFRNNSSCITYLFLFLQGKQIFSWSWSLKLKHSNRNLFKPCLNDYICMKLLFITLVKKCNQPLLQKS